MKDVAELLNDMLENGVISNYAIFGAVAQMRYTEAVVTLDMDVLVALPEERGLDLLSPIYKYCKSRGKLPEGEAIRVGDWPVQFIPAFSPLTEDAMKNAEKVDLSGIPVRVVTPAYLALMALDVGRAKDMARIIALIEQAAVTKEDIRELAGKYALLPAWVKFERKFFDE